MRSALSAHFCLIHFLTMTEPTTTTPSSSTTTMKEDTALFGSLNASIADKLSDSIDAALTVGVSSLPLSDPQRQEKLQAILRHSYWRNVDVMEVYTQRNIFSIQNLTPHQRETVVKLFTSNDDASVFTVPNKTMEADDSTDKENAANTTLKITPQDIPTPEQIKALEQETIELRQKLKQLKRQRCQVLRHTKELEVAQQLAQLASTKLEHTDIHLDVTSTVMGVQGLEQLQSKAKELVEKLDEEKRGREDDTQEIVLPNKKKANLTLEERYEQERENFSTSTQAMAKVQQMVVKK